VVGSDEIKLETSPATPATIPTVDMNEKKQVADGLMLEKALKIYPQR